ncbi:MAG: hypothetical protein K2Q18_00790 [Bdellovibrionales bacterium]|nr:hypothetical protein [Bdellovibrionales bacterium]
MNRDIYKDEFGQYHEVEEELETPLDGFEDDDLDPSEDDDGLDDPFDSIDEENEYDEDEEYANERRHEYDSEED